MREGRDPEGQEKKTTGVHVRTDHDMGRKKKEKKVAFDVGRYEEGKRVRIPKMKRCVRCGECGREGMEPAEVLILLSRPRERTIAGEP